MNSQNTPFNTDEIDLAKRSKNNRKNITIVSNGCVPNRLAGYEISRVLLKAGYKAVSSYEDADIIIFNSCGYCGDRINESKEILKKLTCRKRDDCIIVLTGCIDKIDPEIKNEYRCCEVVEVIDLLRFLGIRHRFDDLYISNCIIDIQETTSEHVFNIITSKGCMGRCSYCAIKKARGSIKSKATLDIISEIENGIDKGFLNFVLWGDDFGAYGLDIGSSFIRLLKSIINKIPTKIDYQLFLHRLNPQWIIQSIEDVCEVLSSNKIKMIYSPIQSGSNRLLKLMNRNYISEDLIKSFNVLKQALPELLLKTDIMVGFPTEEDEDVDETIRMIDAIKIDELVLFRYSGIKDTPAFLLNGHCSEDDKNRRVNKIWDSLPFLRYIIESDKREYWVTDKKDNKRVLAKFNSYVGHPRERGE